MAIAKNVMKLQREQTTVDGRSVNSFHSIGVVEAGGHLLSVTIMLVPHLVGGSGTCTVLIVFAGGQRPSFGLRNCDGWLGVSIRC